MRSWLYLLFAISFILCVVSCNQTSKLANTHVGPSISQVRSSRNTNTVTDTAALTDAERGNGRSSRRKNKKYTGGYYDDKGNFIAAMNLDEVAVISKTRNIPERLGQVEIQFQVNVPSELQSTNWSVELIPYLHRRDTVITMENLIVRGETYTKIQDRDYWQFDKYKEKMMAYSSMDSSALARNDAKLKKMYARFITSPTLNSRRLDSVVPNKNLITYFYSQLVQTSSIKDEREMLITMNAAVRAIDGSSISVPSTDTLKYVVTSVLHFVDTTKRYIGNVVLKKQTLSDRYYLSYKHDDYHILKDLGNNEGELSKIESLYNEMINHTDYDVDTVILTATSSPEGEAEYNSYLAEKRAYSLANYLNNIYNSRNLIKVEWIGEDWKLLERLISQDENIKNKEAILSGIASCRKYDDKEIYMRDNFRKDFDYIRKNLYPVLRAVTFDYRLNRREMTSDTLYSSSIDEIYEHGVELLRNREYFESIECLRGYRCVNTAIAYLSVGYDKLAYDMLKALDEGEAREYLLALACVRLGYIPEGKEHFKRAQEFNPILRFRGNIDPEIRELQEEVEETFY